MIDIKVSLTVTLQGGVMFSKQECLKQLDVKTNSGIKTILVPDATKFDSNTMKLSPINGKDETIIFKTRVCREAQQVINISSAAYENFISNNVPENFKVPSNFKPYNNKEAILLQAWKLLGKNGKLFYYLNQIAESLGGTVKSYQVFDD